MSKINRIGDVDTTSGFISGSERVPNSSGRIKGQIDSVLTGISKPKRIVNNDGIDRTTKSLMGLEDILGRTLQIGIITDAREQMATDLFNTMGDKRSELRALIMELTEAMYLEYGNKVSFESGIKAQTIIDIIIRNLYERTADVGFLSTDGEVRCFLYGLQNRDNSCCNFDLEREHLKLQSRLTEYKIKYSVYSNIIILDNNNRVAVSQNQLPVDTLHDSIISTCSTSGFSEYYGDVSFSNRRELVYCQRITENGKPDGNVIGTLCLVFDFENEMREVFNNLNFGTDGSILALLDNRGQVIYSNGNILANGTNCSYRDNDTVDIQGVKYHVSRKECVNGYQGYKGLGWSGIALVPVKEEGNKKADNKNSAIQIEKSRILSDHIKTLVRQVDDLNRSLKFLIWNGTIALNRQNGAGQNSGLKPVFDEIKGIADQFKQHFSVSIEELLGVIIETLLENIKAISRMGIDIMDRNLYERANDCRWWALTAEFENFLASHNHTEQDVKNVNAILFYINSLYTVYTNLVLFDRNGNIVGASNDKSVIGSSFDTNLGGLVLSNAAGSQGYSVSDFDRTGLYDNRNTYVYGATVTKDNNNVGGIGIVFDSESQFKQMLLDVCPQTEGSFGIYVERGGKVISSTNDSIEVGSTFNIDKDFKVLKNGQSESKIVDIDGIQYIVGATCSFGYREYKNSDGYKNDVLCLVFMRIA